MPLMQVASVGEDAAAVYAEVDETGTCVGGRFVNATSRPVDVTLILNGEHLFSGTMGQGETNRNLPPPRRFTWATGSLHVDLTVRWP